MFERLLELAEQLNEGPVDDSIANDLHVASLGNHEGKTPFEIFPESVAKKLLGEAWDTTSGMPLPASLGNSGTAYDGDVTHEFTRDNACPYYQKNELCGLDGRLCLYDTETFPVCPRYKEGFTRGIPGLDGNKPSVTPQHELPKDPVSDQPPFNNHIR